MKRIKREEIMIVLDNLVNVVSCIYRIGRICKFSF